ncbi:MAG: hypothetical protein WAK21_00005, partial [Candidatus Sulfotelmatobacter sp.]
MAVALQAEGPLFRRMVEDRYSGFVGNSQAAQCDFEIDLYDSSEPAFGDDQLADDQLEVKLEAGEWVLKRGDFRARWNPETKQ